MKPYVKVTTIKEYYKKGTDHQVVAMLLDQPVKRIFDLYAKFILKDSVREKKKYYQDDKQVMADSLKWMEAKNKVSNFVLITNNEEVIKAHNKMINK